MNTKIDLYKNEDYLANNPTWHVEDSPWKAQQILKILRNNNITPESVFEIGCGAGKILEELSKELTETKFVGYEISEHAFKLTDQ